MAVIAGSIQVVVSSKRSFIDQDEVTFIQTNARYALDMMGKDVRMAGYLGCAFLLRSATCTPVEVLIHKAHPRFRMRTLEFTT